MFLFNLWYHYECYSTCLAKQLKYRFIVVAYLSVSTQVGYVHK